MSVYLYVDGVISVHDLPSFTLRTQLNKARGAHLFAIEKTKNNVLLCAALKKKLVIYSWEANDWVETKELVLPDTAKSVVWCNDSLCIGWKKEYNLIHVQTGGRTELFPTGKSASPLACVLPNDQLLLSRDNISIFIGFDGKPTRKYGISWSETPLQMEYTFPYVVAILSKFLEVRTLSDVLIQTIPLKLARFLAIKSSEIYVAAFNNVWKLVPLPMIQQVDQLVAERKYEEALALAESIPDTEPLKKSKIDSIKVLYAYYLFANNQFERALECFTELSMNVLQVLSLYPGLLPRDLKDKYSAPIDLPELKGALVEKALQSLIKYLLALRPSIISHAESPLNNNNNVNLSINEYASCNHLPTIIDTSLLKAYIRTNDPELATFLKQPNYCHVKECEAVLLTFEKYSELVSLFKGKGLHRNALELLVKQGQSKTGRSVYGPSETISYLCGLGKQNMDLILEFSRWVLQVSPDASLKIFTEPRSEETSLPPSVVLAHIKQLAPQNIVPYLEHVINVQKDTTPEFHNELLLNYLDNILLTKKDSLPITHKGARVFAGTEPGILGSTRRKMLDFLEQSLYYNPEKILTKFPYDDLYEERALLMSRIGEHEKALQIYAHKLKDYQMAESYCAKHFSADKEDSKDVYLALLRVYLKPEGGIDPMLQPALLLLNNYYEYIDIPKAMELLPSNTPVTQLFPVFEAALRTNSKNRRNNQVIKSLLKSENLQVIILKIIMLIFYQIREQLIAARSGIIKITDNTICPVCSKKLGLSVFASYPNGVTVHYNCYISQKGFNLIVSNFDHFNRQKHLPCYWNKFLAK